MPSPTILSRTLSRSRSKRSPTTRSRSRSRSNSIVSIGNSGEMGEPSGRGRKSKKRRKRRSKKYKKKTRRKRKRKRKKKKTRRKRGGFDSCINVAQSQVDRDAYCSRMRPTQPKCDTNKESETHGDCIPIPSSNSTGESKTQKKPRFRARPKKSTKKAEQQKTASTEKTPCKK
ncbi:hypothetical protein N9S60_00045 [bacterium]|nr:hypothetical protein [bacterium]